MADGARILDVGCGVGANALWLASEGYKVEAIDVSRKAIKRLIDRGWSNNLYKPQVADVTCLPFGGRGGIFDAAIDCCTLQHVEDIGQALREIYRVLKPGGLLFSILADEGHSMSAFPNGIYTHRWSAGDIVCRFAEDFGIEWCGASRYEDEKYGIIAHWLVRARKP